MKNPILNWFEERLRLEEVLRVHLLLLERDEGRRGDLPAHLREQCLRVMERGDELVRVGAVALRLLDEHVDGRLHHPCELRDAGVHLTVEIVQPLGKEAALRRR